MTDTLMRKAEGDKYKLEIHVDTTCHEGPREWDNLGTMLCSHKTYDLGDIQFDASKYEGWYDALFHNLCNELSIYPEAVKDEEEIYDKFIILPLYAYVHSQIRISTTGFNCSWDSGQIGFIYCSKNRAKEWTNYTEKELYSGTSDREPEVGEHIKVKDIQSWNEVVEINPKEKTIKIDKDSFKGSNNFEVVGLDDIEKVMSNQVKKILKAEVDTYDKWCAGEVYTFRAYKKNYCEECGHTEEQLIDSCGGFLGHDIYENGIAGHIPKEVEHLIEKL